MSWLIHPMKCLTFNKYKSLMVRRETSNQTKKREKLTFLVICFGKNMSLQQLKGDLEHSVQWTAACLPACRPVGLLGIRYISVQLPYRFARNRNWKSPDNSRRELSVSALIKLEGQGTFCKLVQESVVGTTVGPIQRRFQRCKRGIFLSVMVSIQ